jgi:hypothetical protein
MQGVLAVLAVLAGASSAWADSWESREGTCGHVAGYWTVQQEQSGVWVGNIDYHVVGGECAPPSNTVLFYEVRAVLVGDDFFAASTHPDNVCNFHGRMRGGFVRGFEVCKGAGPLPFVLRFSTEPPPGAR